MTMGSREICLILFLFLNGRGGRGTVFTTPGSYLQFDDRDSYIYIECIFISTDTNLRIYREVYSNYRYGYYDATKYHIIPSKTTPILVQVPQQLGNFEVSSRGNQTRTLNQNDLQLKTNDVIDRMDGTTIDRILTYNGSLENVDDLFSVTACYEFQLRIRNVSTTDIGNYTCSVTFQTRIFIAPIQFLYKKVQLDNTISVHEGKSVNISCAAIPGYDAGKISIKLGKSILAESDSNMVTYSFISTRKYDSKRFRCESSKEGSESSIYVKLLVRYAPDVTVISGPDMIYCYPDGCPRTYTFYKWEHLSEKGDHIRFLEGLGSGILILQRLPHQYQISGRYVCTVSNGIPDIYGRPSQKGFISVKYEGPPKFVQENKKIKFVELFKPTAMTFLIYSNPAVEEIWIEAVAPCFTKNETILDFRMSETELLYSEFGNKGIIKGNAITFEFKMFSTEYEMYKIWIKNKRGEDSFDFNIQAVEYDQKQRKDSTGLITSSSIATVLLIYIIVLHICLIVRHRTNRTRRGHIEEPLHFNTYDEIGPISYEAASTRRLVTDQEGPMLPTRLISSPRSESTITTINNRSAMIVSTSSKVSNQYFQVISARSSNDAETEISTSSMFPIGDMMHSDGSYDEVSVASTDNSYQTFQRRSHQDENSSNNNKTSTCSSSSDVSIPESHGASLCEGDANENPYELAIDDNKETHQYSVAVNQCAEIDSARPPSDTDELTSNVSYQSSNDKESCN